MKRDALLRVRLAGSILAAALAAAALAPTAHATFAGGNGKIAITSLKDGNPEIYTIPAFGGDPHIRVTTHPATESSPAWNASGSELAFASNRPGAGSNAGDFEIYRKPPSASATATQLTFNGVADESPAWAPDGTQLVIVREVAGGDTDLVIIAADGSGTTTPLTALASVSGEVEPNWAPNGTRIVFSAFAPGAAQRDIFTILPDGTGLTNLTNTPNDDDREPNWSPRNARITYASALGSNYDIHVMNADGTGDTNITNHPDADRDPAWSPDATRIAFTRRTNGNDNIVNIASTGQYPFPITYLPASETQPDWQRVPPAACQDGLDNDGDTQIDYPNDPGCTSTADNDETNPACSDGIDNDGDTKIDYPDDAGCTSLTDTNETNPACNDGVDNDGDTKIDYPADPGCTSAADNSEFNPPPVACNDGVDNDGDTKIDYPDDPGCTSSSDDNEADPAAPQCNDGLDNDGDEKIDYPADPGCFSASDTDEFNSPPSGVFVRPKSAPRIKVSLVPAFNACTSPNRQHGPPLAFPSCNPPVPGSTAITVGTEEANGAGENSVGSVTLTADPAVPGPPDDSDVIVAGSITDVRCLPSTTSPCGNPNAADGADYTGDLQGSATIRITDRWSASSAGGGADAATVVDFPFPMAFGCAGTADDAIGATCTSNTTFNAIVPQAMRDGKRSVIDVGQIVVSDSGPDGIPSTAPNTLFMKQGLFVP